MNNLDKQYHDLLRTLLHYGIDKRDRTGTGTKSIFGYQIRHKMKEGFPLLTTKKMAIKSIMTELKWFLKGDTNIKYLVENGCHIWTGDAYRMYSTYVSDEWENGAINELFEDGFIIEDLNDNKNTSYRKLTKEEFTNKIKTDDEFARFCGDLGPIYGAQWRKWDGIDQIQNLINELKTNPDSRRLMVNAWNVGELDQMVLPPCHYGFQVYTRELSMEERIDYALSKNDFRFTDAIINEEDYEKYNIPTRAISLMWNQRSVDTFLGLPFNIASYGLLLEMIAKEVNMVPDELIGNLGDVHLYKNHIQQAKEQIGREPYKLPTIELSNVDILNGEFDYEIKGYESHPTIKAPLSN
jgi:thymidylate synthase